MQHIEDMISVRLYEDAYLHNRLIILGGNFKTKANNISTPGFRMHCQKLFPRFTAR